MRFNLKTNQTNMIKQTTLIFGTLALSIAGVLNSEANDRKFAYSYEAISFVPGDFEYEQWVTWKTRDGFDRIDFRHEFEYAFTERFRMGFYLPDWRWENDKGSEIHDVAIEGIYNLTDANEGGIGSSLYGEVKFWDEFVELEGKILLQKNFGPLTVVYNAIIEAEWEGADLEETKGVFAQTLGVSYALNEKLGLGVEAVHEIEYPEWGTAGPSVVYAGPNITAKLGGSLWATVAGLWQVTDEDEPDFQLRTLVGLHF
jgi:hypothetical protein